MVSLQGRDDGLRRLLASHWGHADFRAGQLDVVRAVLDKRDVFAMMPTGGGKSICYQLPAVFHCGVAVVVSPLISLMRDQVARLNKIGISALMLCSDTSKADVDSLMHGDIDLLRILYVSPERVVGANAQGERFRSFVTNLARIGKLVLFAVDEAHCVSVWGGNFRKDYGRL
jgi:ATP-dependent DNA helicase RecQ